MNRIIRYIFDIKPKKELKQSKFSVFSHDLSSTKKKRIIEVVIKKSNKDQRKIIEKARQIQIAN